MRIFKILINTNVQLDSVNKYFDTLFNDPAFATILTIAAIWYSYYLFKRPPKGDKLFFITMSNYQKLTPRETMIVFLNRGNSDIIRKSVLEEHPILIKFDQNLNISDFYLDYNSTRSASFNLVKLSDFEYRMDFDIIKRHKGIILIAKHDSKKHMDFVHSEIKLEGVVANFEIYRDDYSDQLVTRINLTEIPTYIATFFVGIILSFSIRTFLKPLHIEIPYGYLLAGCFIIVFIPIFNSMAALAGRNEYKEFWKLVKESRKFKKLTESETLNDL